MHHDSGGTARPSTLARMRNVLHNAARSVSRDEVVRHNARHDLLDVITRRLGHRLYNRNLAWIDDPSEFRDAWKRFPEADDSVKDRRFVLWSMAKSVRDLDGDSAECGVFAGAGSHLICEALRGSGTDHHHRVFDSFEGLSDPDGRDVPRRERTQAWQPRDLAVPLGRVERNLRQHGCVTFHPGWIPERFDDVADRTFRFVHVDVDLHQPTADSLRFFLPRMVPGGIVLCDDYGSTMCPGAKEAFDEAAREHGLASVIHLTTGQGFVVAR